MGQFVLLLGGARSGKSDFAERWTAERFERVVYLATAEARDAEMAERARAHRARRPAHWRTLEAPLDVTDALEPALGDAQAVLLDCLTLLASNVLIAEETSGRAELRLRDDLERLVALCARRDVTLLLVSNEVGQGVVPAYPLGRQYRDVLGRINQWLAARADVVLYFVAGWPLDLKQLGQEALDRLGMARPSIPWETGEILDLTHPFAPDMPVWPGDPPVEMRVCADMEKAGYRLRQLCCGEHSGTHIGVEGHLRAGGLGVEQLPATALIRPAFVIDFRSAARRNADAILEVADVIDWEARYGRVPAGGIVLLATGWDQRWRDPVAYFNRDADGMMHFPGFSADAARFLSEDRHVAGLGIDAPGIDAGADVGLAANVALLKERRFHLENLTGLERLPATGAWLFIGALPLVGGGGAPARVLAWVPRRAAPAR